MDINFFINRRNKMIKLSKTSKMPCKSFALPAMKTCLGAINSDGKVKDVCRGCYAMKGSYQWRPAKALRENNRLSVSNELHSFASDMLKLLKKEKNNYFRWFDSGDVFDNDFLYEIYKVCKQTPDINHWIPTKAREILDNATWEKLEALDNVKVRYSSDAINGEYNSLHGSTAIHSNQKYDDNKVFKCPVDYDQIKKCGNCRACWHSEKVIAYNFH